jgi:hypothetical protein
MNKFLDRLWRAISFTPFRAGDVVIDRWDGKRVTVERVEGGRAAVVWFEGTTLRRGSLTTRHLKLAA